MKPTFINAFNAREWELQQDGAWVRNIYTNEYILLDRFEESAKDGILLANSYEDETPIDIHKTDSLTIHLLAKAQFGGLQ
jgi:hypothetical protein